MRTKLFMPMAFIFGANLAFADPHTSMLVVAYGSGEGDYKTPSATYEIKDYSYLALQAEFYFPDSEVFGGIPYLSLIRSDSEYTLAGTDYDDDAAYTGVVGLAFGRTDLTAGEGSEFLVGIDRDDSQNSTLGVVGKTGLGNGWHVYGSLNLMVDSDTIDDDYQAYGFGIGKSLTDEIGVGLAYNSSSYGYKDSTHEVDGLSTWQFAIAYRLQ